MKTQQEVSSVKASQWESMAVTQDRRKWQKKQDQARSHNKESPEYRVCALSPIWILATHPFLIYTLTSGSFFASLQMHMSTPNIPCPQQNVNTFFMFTETLKSCWCKTRLKQVSNDYI